MDIADVDMEVNDEDAGDQHLGEEAVEVTLRENGPSRKRAATEMVEDALQERVHRSEIGEKVICLNKGNLQAVRRELGQRLSSMEMKESLLQSIQLSSTLLEQSGLEMCLYMGPKGITHPSELQGDREQRRKAPSDGISFGDSRLTKKAMLPCIDSVTVMEIVARYGEYAFHIEGEPVQHWRSEATSMLLNKSLDAIKSTFQAEQAEVNNHELMLLHIVRQVGMDRVKGNAIMRPEGRHRQFYDQELLQVIYGDFDTRSWDGENHRVNGNLHLGTGGSSLFISAYG